MSSGDILSSDLDLIKEFESLKLKQTLLLESLRNKSQNSQSDAILQDIHSKMSQLLGVFLDAKKSQEEETQEEHSLSGKMDQILTKLDLLEQDVLALKSSGIKSSPLSAPTKSTLPPPGDGINKENYDQKPPIPTNWKK